MKLLFVFNEKNGRPCPSHDRKILAINQDVLISELKEFAEEIKGKEDTLPFKIPAYLCNEAPSKSPNRLFIGEVNPNVVKIITRRRVTEDVSGKVANKLNFIDCTNYDKVKC